MKPLTSISAIDWPGRSTSTARLVILPCINLPLSDFLTWSPCTRRAHTQWEVAGNLVPLNDTQGNATNCWFSRCWCENKEFSEALLSVGLFIRNDGVGGSNPSCGTTKRLNLFTKFVCSSLSR